MPTPFAINGLGRIGRALLRHAHDRDDLELVAVNDLAAADQLARLVARDTLHGRFDGEIECRGDDLIVDGRAVKAFRQPDAAGIPWDEAGVRIVVDATGTCTRRSKASLHRRGGVAKVIVSANALDLDATICVGVNDAHYSPQRHHLLSAASCTTNCLAPVAHLLHTAFGIERAILNTVHSYNNDQRLLESPHPDPRRARAAALNIVPTTTSAVEAIGRAIPALAGRIEGIAIRVPTPNVSLIDLVAELGSGPSLEEIELLFRRAAGSEMAGILAVSDEPLVSSDFLGNPHSAIVDLPLLQAIDERLFRIVAWYDNEWGHAARLADLVANVGALL